MCCTRGRARPGGSRRPSHALSGRPLVTGHRLLAAPPPVSSFSSTRPPPGALAPGPGPPTEDFSPEAHALGPVLSSGSGSSGTPELTSGFGPLPEPPPPPQDPLPLPSSGYRVQDDHCGPGLDLWAFHAAARGAGSSEHWRLGQDEGRVAWGVVSPQTPCSPPRAGPPLGKAVVRAHRPCRTRRAREERRAALRPILPVRKLRPARGGFCRVTALLRRSSLIRGAQLSGRWRFVAPPPRSVLGHPRQPEGNPVSSRSALPAPSLGGTPVPSRSPRVSPLCTSRVDKATRSGDTTLHVSTELTLSGAVLSGTPVSSAAERGPAAPTPLPQTPGLPPCPPHQRGQTAGPRLQSRARTPARVWPAAPRSGFVAWLLSLFLRIPPARLCPPS